MTNLTKFRELGLSEAMLNSLQQKGFEEPTPIQAKTIPFLLTTTKDLIGKAQTGTGKTAAFGIPLIEKLEAKSKKVQAIILAPTRELALQVCEELNSFAEEKKARIVAIYGGAPIDRQISQLKQGVEIVVGTPGRVLDHLERGSLDISQISNLILDEADEMLNMGFVEDIEQILQATPKNRRVILFSATMPARIEKLAAKYMQDYEMIEVASKQTSRDNISQIYFEVANSDKFEALYRIIDVEEDFYGMVFVRTKIEADEIAHKLYARGLSSESLHGDLSQSAREKVLKKFREKRISVLVATDVAARGIDVDNLTHVVNYSLPQDSESYVHRIGRTGRAGKKGIAITLITPSEFRKINHLQREINATIDKKKLPQVGEVIAKKTQRVRSLVAKAIAENNFSELKEIATEILSANEDAENLVAALLKLAFKNELNEESYREISQEDFKKTRNSFADEGNSRFSNQGRSYVDRQGTCRLFIAKGRVDGFDVRGLVNFVQSQTGVSQSKIDDVKILDNFSFFAAPFEDAEEIIRNFKKVAKGGQSLVSKAKEKEGGSSGFGGGGRGNQRKPRAFGAKSGFKKY
jgi:ATP-dependent RNA helicase DeaD